VYSPHIGRVELYEISGHFPYYRESQFAPLFQHPAGQIVDFLIQQLESEQAESFSASDEQSLIQAAGVLNVPLEQCGYRAEDPPVRRAAALRAWQHQQERYLLKPMNCPHHVMIYKSEPHSYRDLPIRYAEFGTVYRYEKSGELTGLTRVRGFTVDDAHLFVTPEQLLSEFIDVARLIQYVFSRLGLTDFRVRVGVRDPQSDKYVGDPAQWELAASAIVEACQQLNLPYTIEEGEAAFYGPKLDFVVRDVLRREWQLGTVQVDYNLPERFDLEYVDADNQRKRPVMIHRAPFGSVERFVGILIEHFAGHFPPWLAPMQALVIPIREAHNDYAREVVAALRGQGLRVEADLRDKNMRNKIKEGRGLLVPWLLIVGDQDVENRSVSVRLRTDEDLGAMPLDAFASMAGAIVREQSERLS
jgi:threonyl-tRNA synthetase